MFNLAQTKQSILNGTEPVGATVIVGKYTQKQYIHPDGDYYEYTYYEVSKDILNGTLYNIHLIEHIVQPGWRGAEDCRRKEDLSLD